MWILPKQLHTLASVLDTEESEKDLNEFCQECETSLMWRSKPSLLRTWLRRWKANNWMKHLSTRMLRPSHTKYFVDAWTSLVVDSHVNRLAPQEIDKVLKTLVTSIPTSAEESVNANLELFSSKTLKESSQAKQQTKSQFSSMSSETWKAWVTEQRQEYSQRLKLAHLTKEKESSSWGTPATNDANKTPHCEINSNQAGLTRSVGRAEANWATPRASATDSTRPNGKGGIPLAQQAKSWATPNTMDTLPARSPEKLAEAKKKGGCKNLREEVMNYPTPRTSDAEGGRIETFVEDGTFKSKRHKSNQTFGAKLRDAVESWPTPTTAEGTKIGNQPNYGQVGLSNHPEIVGEPTREKGIKGYPTPTARDWKGTYKTVTRKDGKSRMDNLPQVADSLQDPTNHSTNGKNHALNPSWVEQLMGLPVGWTDLGSWGTESCQTQQQ